MIFELLEIFEKMGFKLEITEFNIILKNLDSKLKQVIDNRVLSQISFNEFKAQIYQINFEERETIAEGCVDQCLKNIFDLLEINLNEEILYPFRSAIIKDALIRQSLAFDEIMESFFNEIESGSESSLRYFIVTLPKLLNDVGKKYFLSPTQPRIDGSKRLMELFCLTILNEKGKSFKKIKK